MKFIVNKESNTEFYVAQLNYFGVIHVIHWLMYIIDYDTACR